MSLTSRLQTPTPSSPDDHLPSLSTTSVDDFTESSSSDSESDVNSDDSVVEIMQPCSTNNELRRQNTQRTPVRSLSSYPALNKPLKLRQVDLEPRLDQPTALAVAQAQSVKVGDREREREIS